MAPWLVEPVNKVYQARSMPLSTENRSRIAPSTAVDLEVHRGTANPGVLKGLAALHQAIRGHNSLLLAVSMA